jgi:hypothetical protein
MPGKLNGQKVAARPKLVAILGQGDTSQASAQILWVLKYAKFDKHIEAAAISMGWKQDDANVLERLEVIREKYDHEDTRTARRWSELGFVKMAELLGADRQDMQPMIRAFADEVEDGIRFRFVVDTVDGSAESRPRIMIDRQELTDFNWVEVEPNKELDSARAFSTMFTRPHGDVDVLFFFPDFNRVRIITSIDAPSYRGGSFTMWSGVSLNLKTRTRTALRLDHPDV